MSDCHSVLFCRKGVHAAFYSQLISTFPTQSQVKVENFEYNAGAPHYITNLIKAKYRYLLEMGQDAECKIFFTYDNIDSFYNVLDKDYWIDLQTALPTHYASIAEIVGIMSSGSIEDWILDDYAGVLSCLSLPQNFEKPTGSAFYIMKALYQAANKSYIPANTSSMQQLISSLNLGKIVSRRQTELGCLIV